MAAPSIPINIAVIAPFNAVPEGKFKLRLIQADPENPDAALQELGLSLSVPVPQTLIPSGWVDLRIMEMKDFHPDGLIARNPFLQDIADARDFIREALGKGEKTERIYDGLSQWKELPIKISYTPPSASAPAPPPPASSSTSMVDDILSMVSVSGDSSPAPAAAPSPGAASGSADPREWSDDLDRVLSQLMVNIFTNPDFRRFEESWRGLALLNQRGLAESSGKAPQALLPDHPRAPGQHGKVGGRPGRGPAVPDPARPPL